MMKYDYPADCKKSFSSTKPFTLQKSLGIVFHHIDGTWTKQRKNHGSLSQYRRIRGWYLRCRASGPLLLRYFSGQTNASTGDITRRYPAESEILSGSLA